MKLKDIAIIGALIALVYYFLKKAPGSTSNLGPGAQGIPGLSSWLTRTSAADTQAKSAANQSAQAVAAVSSGVASIIKSFSGLFSPSTSSPSPQSSGNSTPLSPGIPITIDQPVTSVDLTAPPITNADGTPYTGSLLINDSIPGGITGTVDASGVYDPYLFVG